MTQNPEITILTANVGNSSFLCFHKKFKLCNKLVEDRIRDRIKEIKPAIIAFQELLSPMQESTKKNQRNTLPQIRRILGSDYSIMCDNRQQFTALGLHQSTGKFANSPLRNLGLSKNTYPPIKGCDSGFSLFQEEVILFKNMSKIHVVVAHLNSRNCNCRIKMIEQLQEQLMQLSINDKILILGDFNLDIWRHGKEKSAVKFALFLKQFPCLKIHNELNIDELPLLTFNKGIIKATFDFICSNFLEGDCLVLNGEENLARLDGGKGTDHFSVFGKLNLGE